MIQALETLLQQIAREYSPASLASSLSAEDMVLTDAIARLRLPIELFMLDTGRLHQDTLDLIPQIRQRYGRDVTVYQPDTRQVLHYVQSHGRDAFYGSIDLRERCCDIRKVQPLRRALEGKRAWISGQRREHAAGRAQLAEREFDARHGLQKFNPLAAWSEEAVWDYVRAYDIPYNRLYDQGYRSIGCAPCTRPVLPGENVRAGRWWWEQSEHTECGIHLAGVEQ